jgi:hypothetical protein
LKEAVAALLNTSSRLKGKFFVAKNTILVLSFILIASGTLALSAPENLSIFDPSPHQQHRFAIYLCWFCVIGIIFLLLRAHLFGHSSGAVPGAMKQLSHRKSTEAILSNLHGL